MHRYISFCRIVAPLLVAAALVACVEPGTESEPLRTQQHEVVYGVDNRTDHYAEDDAALRDLTQQSIVALMQPGTLDMSDPDDIQISAGTLGVDRNLCDGQRFFDQPTGAWCSATLIDDDLILTAGHCVETQSECEDYRFVFDYYYESAGELANISADDDVYQCRELVVQTVGGGLDYAIVQLDRVVDPIHQRAPVRLDDLPLALGQSVTVIGFGSGIPAKIDDGGHVTDPRAGTLDYFEGTLDTFGGNSGSGVFTAAGEVTGILVRGETDYVPGPGGDFCQVVNVLPDDGSEGAEDVTYVARAIEDLCEVRNWDSPALCGGATGTGWCDSCEGVEDCPDGWWCDAYDDAPTVTFCSQPCTTTADCNEGHFCNESGGCQPERADRCSNGDVWSFDECRRRVNVSQLCSDAEQCIGSSCEPRPAGDTCAGAETITATTQTITSVLTGYVADTSGSCAGAGPDRVYHFNVAEAVQFSAFASGFDTVVYLRRTCDSAPSEILCNDDLNPPDRAAYIQGTLDPGDYYLFMDAWDTNVGTYTLELEFTDPGEVQDGDNCSNATELEPETATYVGDLFGFRNDYTGSCAGQGPDEVFWFELDEPTDFVADASGFDTVLYLRQTCDDPGTEVVCHDDVVLGEDVRSHVEATLPPGVYYLFMDAFGQDFGEYELALEFSVSCGDGCTPGDSRCGGVGLEFCGVGAGGCTNWGGSILCPGNEVCQTISPTEAECVPDCTDTCPIEGLAECFGSGVRYCRDFNGNGCVAWGAAEACGADEVCEGAECVASCVDSCVEAETRCGTDDTILTCENDPDTGCLDWSLTNVCGLSEVCVNGDCREACADGCSLNTRRCVSSVGYQVCTLDADGCTAWADAQNCGDLELCSDGLCFDACPDNCTDGSRRCASGGGVEICIGIDMICNVWVPEQDCDPDNEFCVEAECVSLCDGACEVGDMRCGGNNVEVCLSGSTCPDWLVEERCDDDQTCLDGACVNRCMLPCEVQGDTRCDFDDQIQVCEWDELLQCLSWLTFVCEDGSICGDGECVIEACEDLCSPGEATCSDGLQDVLVCEIQRNGCAEWETIECEAGCNRTNGTCLDACEDDSLEPNDDVPVELDPGEYELTLCGDDIDGFTMVFPDDGFIQVELLHQGRGDLEWLGGWVGDTQVFPVETGSSFHFAFEGNASDTAAWSLQAGEPLDSPYSLVVWFTNGDLPADCDAGETLCSEDSGGFRKCLEFDDGGTGWSSVETCGPTSWCTDGECVYLGPDETDTGLTTDPDDDPRRAAPGDGCGCATTTAGPLSASSSPPWFLALGVVFWTNRRVRRQPSR